MKQELNFLRNLLKSSHDSLGELLSLDREKSEQIFDTHFHVDSAKSKELLQNIHKDIEDKKHTIIITGYKGCGKSTFSYYLQKKLPFCSYRIDFELNVDTKLLVQGTLVQYICNKIRDDISSNRQITNKFLSVFFKDKHNADYLDNFDVRGVFFNFFSFLENKGTRIINLDINSFTYQLKKKLLAIKPQIEDLFTIMILWDIASRIVNNKKQENIFIILDNLDVLVDYAPLDMLFKDYFTARNNCINLFRRINYNSLGFKNNPTRDYTFTFILRETTLATVIEHFFDKDKMQYPEGYEFSTVIQKEEIIIRRLEYVKNEFNNEQIAKITEQIYSLFNDDNFIKESFFCLFNNDYRKSIDVLFESIEKKNTFILDYLTIKSSYPKNTSVGSSGLFIRVLCDLFSENKYFNKLLMTDGIIGFWSPNSSINISRLILTFLDNQRKSSNTVVSIQDILDVFDKLFEKQKVINYIWYLFSLRLAPFWNHLITFDRLSGLENFQGRLLDGDILFNNIDKNSTIRITSAGTFFLDTILTHFEYYSCRMNMNSNGFDKSISLFDKINADFYDQNFRFDVIIQSTIDFVKECSNKLRSYYEGNILGKPGFENDDSFLASMLSYHLPDGNPMFHIERVIHSHIDYLDVYRRYVINLLDDNNQKKEANERIINFIKQYIDMFGYYNKTSITHYSKQSKVLCRYYNNCIQKIEKSTFTDFTMPIDRNTGREIDKSEINY
jgi:hypothetical protein